MAAHDNLGVLSHGGRIGLHMPLSDISQTPWYQREVLDRQISGQTQHRSLTIIILAVRIFLTSLLPGNTGSNSESIHTTMEIGSVASKETLWKQHNSPRNWQFLFLQVLLQVHVDIG